MMAGLCLELHDVSFHYSLRTGYLKHEKIWVLQDISFNVFSGESLGIVGHNGAGKTTLLRLLTGILSPDKGHIVNHDASISLLSLQVGFTPYLTGRENAILSGLALGVKKREILANMERIRDIAELSDYFDQPISTYSTGMRARLGFAIAFQLEPDILLIDEILGVGDEDFREKSSCMMQERIRSDKTVILVSHQGQTIKDLCDRIVILDRGRIAFVGQVDEGLALYREIVKRTKDHDTNK